MRIIIVFYLFIAGMAMGGFSVYAESSMISMDIQKDIDPAKAIEIFKDIVTVIPEIKINGGVSATVSPEKLKEHAETIANRLSPYVRADETLGKLNREIKDTIGIDVPVFLKAILKGFFWLGWFIVILIQRLVS